MLKLEKIVKHYVMGENVVQALKGADIEFRQSEFVSILGPSGCGKTTMLNIIGGLDRYTSGDLRVDGKSTKDFKDRDWDAYRNRTIGFVFQNYNLISHQTVLDNVAIALTLSGVSLKERRERALKALGEVGIADQANKKPNQLSGGQMQRVAIARSLVNNPKIILADEPTGALDSQTSEQIMRILKDVSKDRLVVMVTHNSELAEQYSTRIVRLKDGEIIEDTNPVKPSEAKNKIKSKNETNTEVENTNTKMTSMSYTTALKLSFKNLLTKKTRTILTAIAGSIGIIGVAIVLAISSGMNAYIDTIQRETLAGFPIRVSQFGQISEESRNMSFGNNTHEFTDSEEIYYKPENTTYNYNNFSNELIDYISEIKDKTLAVSYDYSTQLNLLYKDDSDKVSRVPYTSDNSFISMMMQSISSSTSVMFQQLPSESFVEKYYDVLKTHPDKASMPSDVFKLTLVVDEDNYTDKALLRTLTGITNFDETNSTLGFDYFLGKTFYLAYNDDMINTQTIPYEFNNAKAVYDKITDPLDSTQGIKMVITDIIRIKSNMPTAILSNGLCFPGELIEKITADESNSNFAAALAQKSLPEIKALITASNGGVLDGGASLIHYLESVYKDKDGKTYASEVLAKIFAIDTSPAGVAIYASNFDTKEYIVKHLDTWNKEHPDNKIIFTDLAEMFTKMIKSLIDVISIVLTAFSILSLVVSTIMIGIITYVSVVERTKEIGILRSIGARKKDISRVFNAETMIIGFTAGLIGIIVTYLLSIPINIIVGNLTGVATIAALPLLSAGALIVISVSLTLVAGLIPSRIAAKKDPVIALRTE